MKTSIAAIILLILSGCVDDADGVSVFVSGHVAPDDQCVFSPENDFYLGPGVLDLSFDQANYFLHPLYNNQLVSRSSVAPLQADPNSVRIEGAVVRILDGDRNPVYGPDDQGYTAEGTTVVPSAGTDGPGRRVGNLHIIPPNIGADLRSRIGTSGLIYASVKPFGKTNGDVDVELDEFLWPIRLCNECLRGCIDPGSSAELCFVGQDSVAPVDDCS